MSKHVSAFLIAALLLAVLLGALPVGGRDGSVRQSVDGAAVPQIASPLYLPLVGGVVKQPQRYFP